MTWKYDNIADVIEQIGLTSVDWQPQKLKKYDAGQYYDGVVIGWNYGEYGEIIDTYLEASGKGCRTIETLNRDSGFDWFQFLHQYHDDIWNKQAHFARIDVACDLEDGSIPFKRLWRYTYNRMFICRSKIDPELTCMRQEKIYFGSEKSDRFLRIYNKALQMGLPDTDWLRFEFQLRNDNATSFYLNWEQHRDLGKLFSGMMIDYLRFVDIPRGWTKQQFLDAKQNNNRSRFKTSSWWNDFIGDAERIQQLYLPGEEYTLGKVEHVLKHNAASTIKTFLIAHDNNTDELLEAIKHCKINNKQKTLLQQLGKIVPTDYENSGIEYFI